MHRFLCALVAMILSTPFVSSLGAAERPPNVVHFLADELGRNDLGAYGSTLYRTPNLDRMATEGMLFTDASAAKARLVTVR